MLKRSRTLMPLKYCPPGLFLFEGTLCFRSEYFTNNDQPDAYIVESGEYFWGGAKTKLERLKLRVEPVTLDPDGSL